jgi:hypothetical protein
MYIIVARDSRKKPVVSGFAKLLCIRSIFELSKFSTVRIPEKVMFPKSQFPEEVVKIDFVFTTNFSVKEC